MCTPCPDFLLGGLNLIPNFQKGGSLKGRGCIFFKKKNKLKFRIFNEKKNHTHVKKVGLTSEFPFGIYWWTLKNPKDHNFEKGKKIIYHQRYHRFTHMYQKPQSYEVQFLRYEVRQNFLSFWALFCPFNLPCPPPLTTQEKKILKNWKKYLDRYGMQ